MRTVRQGIYGRRKRCRIINVGETKKGPLRQRSLFIGGDEEDRTPDPLLARQVLSQLSYAPSINKQSIKMVGLRGLGPLTSRLSGVRSNQLSYRPILDCEGKTLKTKY